MVDQKNLIIALLISVAILFGFHYFYEGPRIERAKQEQKLAQERQEIEKRHVIQPVAPVQTGPLPRAQALALNKRIQVETPHLKGSINLKGGIIDDVVLKDYKETIEKDSPQIALLSPEKGQNPYYAEFGWVMAGSQTIDLPNASTEWQANDSILTPKTPVTLYWENPQGIRFERRISIDENYLFSIVQKVTSKDKATHTLYPYGLISRTGTPALEGTAILHEGFVGVFNGSYKEEDYKEAREKSKIDLESKGGWMGVTDKYWLAALAPEQNANYKTTINHTFQNNEDKYQVDFLGPQYTLSPDQSIEHQTYFFAGAKKVKLLASYREEYNIDRFDLAIDFGWLYFLTKPLFYILDFLNGLIGNFGLCILVLTVLVRLALFPLANNSYKTMSKMRVLGPEIQRLKERYGNDRMRMNQEMMLLYKREKVNPMAGCLPILIQIPVFIALYKVLYVAIEMRHAPFFGWIQDLSMPDPTSIFNLFGLLPFEPFFTLGAWPIIMGITMYLQQRLNPQPTDPTQAKVMAFLPLVFTFVCASFPSGLVIYWSWGNILSMLQQWAIMRKYKPKLTKETLSHIKQPKK